MRKYLSSHSWIDFQLSLDEAGFEFWRNLGRVEESIWHISRASLPLADASRLYGVYLARSVRATIAIEGSTLTEEEVSQIEKGDFPKRASRAYEEQEAKNIFALYNHIAEQILSGHQSAGQPPQITLETIKKYNGMVRVHIEDQETVSPGGEFRSHGVRIGRSRGAPHVDLPYLTNRLCEWLYRDLAGLEKLGTVAQGVLRATLAHLYIAWIHPFADGNGRTARALELHILLDSGVPDIAAHLLSNYYHRTRQRYYEALDRSRHEGALAFLRYALDGFRIMLREQLEELKRQQLPLLWRDLVYREFTGKNSSLQERRRDLALTLVHALGQPISMQEILNHAPPRLALEYMESPRKLERDLVALMQLGPKEHVGLPGMEREVSVGIIQRTEAGIQPRLDLLFAFQPRSRD
ncbi:MAG: Fic family protein [Chloroflexi bacterium]|nr:Fic family protein [Chloroflexota bacterium]